MRGQEVEAEGEVGGGEDGEGFDEDVGDGFVAGEMRVELVSGWWREGGWWLVRGFSMRGGFWCRRREREIGEGSDRANKSNISERRKEILSHDSSQVIGNV